MRPDYYQLLERTFREYPELEDVVDGMIDESLLIHQQIYNMEGTYWDSYKKRTENSLIKLHSNF